MKAMGDARDEEVDLAPERRQRVAMLFDQLGMLSHYDLLGVASEASRLAIKRAYYEHARTLHPDRYFGRRLGGYREKMRAIFARMTLAYETLTDGERRAEYDAELRAAVSAAPSAPTSRPTAKAEAAMEALRKRASAARGKVEEHARAAARARAAGDLAAAESAYRAALALAPGDAALQAAHAEVQRDVQSRLVASYRTKAQLDERLGKWEDAADAWRRVVDATPDDADAVARLASALAKADGGGR